MLWFKEVLVNAIRVGARQGHYLLRAMARQKLKQPSRLLLLREGGSIRALGGSQWGWKPTGIAVKCGVSIPWNYFVIDKLIPAISTPTLQASVNMMME